MKITLNGEKATLTTNATVSQLLHDKGYEGMLVAVAVNDSFVPKSQHQQTQLQEGDSVDIVAPMQGG